MSFIGSFFPLIGWLLYPLILSQLEVVRPSLSAIMARHRLRWVRNAVTRDTPVDAILTSNLMGSISFFASTTVLLILALFTVYGQFGEVEKALDALRVGPPLGDLELEAELLALLSILTLGFLSFTLSLRQFNHFCILLGAAEPGKGDKDEIAAIAKLNTRRRPQFHPGHKGLLFRRSRRRLVLVALCRDHRHGGDCRRPDVSRILLSGAPARRRTRPQRNAALKRLGTEPAPMLGPVCKTDGRQHDEERRDGQDN